MNRLCGVRGISAVAACMLACASGAVNPPGKDASVSDAAVDLKGPVDLKGADLLSNACMNTVRDGTETDVNCGGTSCPKCGANRACMGNSDCVSNTCVSNVCKDASLIAHWTMNETTGTTIADSSGNNNVGMGMGTFAFSAGKLGNAFDTINGANAFIQVAHSPSLALPKAGDATKLGPLTMSLWLTSTAMIPDNATLLMKTSSTDWNDGYGIYTTGSGASICAFVGDYNGSATSGGSSCFALGPTTTFKHVAATYDGAMLKLYVDGILFSTVGITSAKNDPASSALLIGKGRDGGGATPGPTNWKGKIDEVRIYNRALPEAEILQLAKNP